MPAPAIRLFISSTFSDLKAERDQTIIRRLPPNAVFIATWADVPILEYLQLVEHQRPDVETVNLFFVPADSRLQLLAGHTQRGHPMYTSEPELLPHDGVVFEYDGDCECYRIGCQKQLDAPGH